MGEPLPLIVATPHLVSQEDPATTPCIVRLTDPLLEAGKGFTVEVRLPA
jgi:hypothetical protein